MPPSCSTLTGAELPQTKKVLHLCAQGCFGPVQLFAPLWTVACQASLSGGFSRQEYWSLLANTGCHILLEHCFSCCPLSTWCCQNPCDPSSCTTSTLALTEESPSPPGQPQGQTPVDDPHAEVEIKPQLKPGDSVAKEEDTKPSHQLYKLQIKSI